MPTVTLVLFVLLFPALALLARERLRFAANWSPLIVCYIAGLLAGNLGILPAGAAGTLDAVSTAAVAVSIPLLLFSVDIRKWRELSGKAGLAFVLAAVSIVAVAAGIHLAFGKVVPESSKVAGMLVGLYTGGTPNLAAIKTALNVDLNVYIAVHTSDMVVSAVYLLAVMTIAKPVLSKFLPVKDWSLADSVSEVLGAELRLGDYRSKKVALGTLAALGLAAVAVGLSFGFSLLFPESYQTMATILGITTLALAASLIPRVRALPKTFQTGEYVLYVFCVAVGAMGDFRLILNEAPIYLLYVTGALFGSFILHALLCAIFKIDVDTMLIVSTSAICSPPFVGVVAVSIKARKLIVPGITTGIIGYAVGNYLGIMLSRLLG